MAGKRTNPVKPEDDVTRWVQTRLFGEALVELRAHIGIVGVAGHVQMMVEARDPETKTLQAMVSFPHRDIAQLEAAVDELCSEIKAVLLALL